MFLGFPYFIESRSIKFTSSIQRLGDRDDRTTDFRTGHPEPTGLDRGLHLRSSHRYQRTRHRQKDSRPLGLSRAQTSVCDGILCPEGLLVRALIFVGVYVLMCAFGREAIAWLDARYVETAIYQALEPVIGWIVIGGLVGFLALLVVGALYFLLMFIGLVIAMLRSRDPWTE